jgi:prevent-host-death family protein
MSVAEAKKRLSELMSRVAYKNEQFIIGRRGKPVAALVSAEDLARLEERPVTYRGLLAAVGAWAEFEDLDQVVEDIYQRCQQAQDRPVSLDQ